MELFLMILFGLQIAGVLTNDVDPTGEGLTAVIDVAPAVGNLQLRPDGNFTFTPPPEFDGAVTFTYRARTVISGVVSKPATVTITVKKKPIANNDAYEMWQGDVLNTASALRAVDDSYETNEDTILVVPAPGVLGNDK